MPGVIEKGTITNIDGNKARVSPIDAFGCVSAQITIPWHLRASSGNLEKGTEVVYVLFGDQSGLLLGRMDGEWGDWLPELTIKENLDVGGDATINGETTVGKNMKAGGNITADGNATVKGEMVVNGSAAINGSVSANGNVTTPGDVIAGSISFKGHTHSGVVNGTENTNPPQ